MKEAKIKKLVFLSERSDAKDVTQQCLTPKLRSVVINDLR
jgi:hypothetical protein